MTVYADKFVVSRPQDQYIPPVQEPYTYIIFRASEVKDLAVDEAPPKRGNVHDDPAVLGVSGVFQLRSRASYMMKPLTDVTSKARLSESAKTVWITRCLPSDYMHPCGLRVMNKH